MLCTVLFAGLFLSFAGCNNINQLNRKLASLNLGDDHYEVTGGGAFVLQTAMPSQQKPGYFDLIGTGGQFDLFCSTAQPCKCEFTFTYPSQGTQTSQVPAIDQESDLLRCSSAVPSGITSYDIAIISGDGNLSSNKVTVTLTNGNYAGSTFYIDLSQKSSFVNVKRFQCRKLETVVNPLDGDFIDPFQSEDPKIIYPFNYYTTNVSESLLKAQHNANQDWDCTLIPNESHDVPSWANPFVFSRASCDSDSFCMSDVIGLDDLMYPIDDLSQEKVSNIATSNIGARGTFSLAKQPYGVFTVPVQAAVAPKDYVSSTYGIIGYAAESIPSGGTTSSCPAITLPSGARWVKLWNFRAAAITPPQYVKGITRFGEGSNVGNIACNPGGVSKSCDYANVAGDGVTKCVKPDGAMSSTMACKISDFHDYSSQPLEGGAFSLSRLMGLQGATPACYNILASSWNASSTESWQVSPYAFADATPAPDVSFLRSLAWGLFSDASGTAFNNATVDKSDDYFKGSAGGGIASAVPKESTMSFDQFTSENYTDNLFVVTPESVEDDAIKNESPAVGKYLPVTYRSASKCDPTQVGYLGRETTCSGADSMPYELQWTIMTTAVGSQVSQVYPVCVVQFYE